MKRWSGVVLTGLGSLAIAGCGGDSESTTTAGSAAELPPGAIAVVAEAPDGTITEDDFDRALTQTAGRQGLRNVPPPDELKYERLADATVSDLILSRWVLGEAEDRGIEVTDREIDEELEAVKQQQFGSEKAFQDFLDESGFTLDEARERISLQLISDRIQSEVLSEDVELTQQQQIAEDFQTEFQQKWRARTLCAEGFVIDRCANGPAPETEQGNENGALGVAP